MAKRGVRLAFDELVYRHRSYIKPWIFKFCKSDEHLAEEIYSLTLVKAWQKIKTFKGEAAFKTWVCSIARRNFFDQYRKNKKVKFVNLDYCSNLTSTTIHNEEDYRFPVEITPEFSCLDDKLPSSSLESEENDKRLKSLLDKIMRKLKPKDKEILRLYYRDRLEYKQIAEKLEIPLGTVMSRLYYARKNAEKIIKRLNYRL
jgi:RNA polymerase sigma factor (sigma-70 family)